MAIIKQHAGVKKTPATYPHMAGAVHKAVVQYVITAALDVSEEFVEIWVLPQDCKIVGLRVESEGIGETADIDVGFITGLAGDASDTTRTLGAELIDGGTKNTVIELTPSKLATMDVSRVARGIGFNFTADIAGGAADKVTIEVEYVA